MHGAGTYRIAQAAPCSPTVRLYSRQTARPATRRAIGSRQPPRMAQGHLWPSHPQAFLVRSVTAAAAALAFFGRSVVGVWSPEHLGGTPSAGDQAGRAHPARSGATTPGQGCSQGRSVLRGRWTARRCRPARLPDARPSRRPRRRRCAAASPWSPCSAGRRGSLRARWRSPRGGPAGSRRHGSGPGRRPAARTGLLAANVEPYLRADGTKVWSLMQLESEVEGLEHAPRLVQCWSRPVGRSCWGVGRPRWWRR